MLWAPHRYYRLTFPRPVPPPPAAPQSVSSAASLYLGEGGLALEFTDLAGPGGGGGGGRALGGGGGGGGGGALPLGISRTYSSLHLPTGSAGNGMMHSLEICCAEQTEGGQQVVYALWFNGQSHRFVQLAPGVPGRWQRPVGSKLWLERMITGVRVIDHQAGLFYEFGLAQGPTGN